MPKLRVLLLLHGLTLNGAPKVILDAMEELRDELEIFTISLEGGPREERCRQLGPLLLPQQQQAPPPPSPSPPPPPPPSPIEALRHRARAELGRLLPRFERPAPPPPPSAPVEPQVSPAERALADFRPDLIYVNTVASLPIPGMIKLPPAPVLLHVHELRSYQDRFLASHRDAFLGWPARYIAVSEAVRRELVDHCGVDAAKVRIVHAFINERDPFPAPESLPAPQDGAPLLVGGSGYPVWIKGSSLWVQMAAELAEILGRDRVRFRWVGIGTQDELSWQFREMARKVGVSDLVEFIEMTTEPLRYFADLDVFALSSWEDPCPLVVLENMMLQKPVVCFGGSGGSPEEVGEAGVVVPRFSPRAMAEAIAALAADPARRQALGRSARQRVLSRFTARVQAPKLLQEMQALVRAAR